jgi:uncharacterized protein YjdB
MNRSPLDARLVAVLSLAFAVVACGPDAPTTPTPTAAVVGASAGAQANAGGVTIAAPASIRLHPGDKIQLTGTVVLPNGKDKDNFPIKWSTSNAAVATVDEKTGEVTAVAPGAVTITAKAGPRTGQIALTVMVPVARVAISPNPVIMDWDTRDTTRVIVTVAAFDASGAPISDLADRSIVWKSDDTTTAPLAATDQPGQERVTAAVMGKTTISVTVDGVRGDAQVTVKPEFGYFNNGGYDPTLNLGDSTSLSMTFVTVNGERIPAGVPGDVTWVSTNPAVLTVTPLGEAGGVKAVGLGTASIEGTYRGFTLAATITVVATVASIDVFLPVSTLKVGQTAQATATVYTDRRVVLPGAVVTWTTGSSGAASVSSSGLVTALEPGVTMIIATLDGITSWAFIEVFP